MDWRSFKGATCLPECWCEAPRLGSWILEPVNTWSNLFYIFIGVYFVLSRRKLTIQTNLLTQNEFFPQVYGVALILMGFSSFFYHASQTLIGQWFDLMGMYFVTFFYIAYNLLRAKKIKISQFLPFYISSNLILGFIIYFSPEVRRYLFAIILLITFFHSIWLHFKSRTIYQIKYFYLSILSYGAGQFLWYLDKNRHWCDPYGWINGHGLWHLLTGMATFFAYLYFMSEEEHPSKHLKSDIESP